MATTQFEIDNALMAGRAYFDTRASTNRFPVPQGWAEFKHRALDSGFEAVSFTDGTRIVISYAGTDFTDFFGDWTDANVPLVFGFASDQLRQAALYYLEVKAANPPGTVISFTGHSLGGGLAALMAVFFDEQAITFDQAPFENASSSTIRDNLEDYLKANGYSDSLLTSLVPEFVSYGGYGTRTTNVTGYYMEGEALQYPPASAFNTIGTQTMLPQNSPGLGLDGPLKLHSQALLTAFLLNDAFRELTYQLPDLLKTLFDKALYARGTEPGPNAQRNFLDNLIRHQIGVAADPVAGVAAIPADAMLDRFVVDLRKLAPDTWGMAAGTDMAKALTVVAMEYHYFKETGATQLFTLADYGLHFKYSDIGAPSYKSLPKLAEAVHAYLTPEEKSLLNGRLVKQDAWHIQSGVGGMIVNAGAGNDAMIGGANSDALWGGAGIDVLIGGANNDVLAGQAGNDYLLGGIGNDTYIFSSGDGTDTVHDTDGSGSIVLNGATLTGGALVAGTTNVWKDTAQGLTYTLKGSGASQVLLISKDGSTDGIRVQGWQSGQLGLAMSGAAASATPAVITGADGYSDGLTGTGSADRLLGLSGNDALNGGDGDDIVDGGLGDDLIGGGAGSDLIYGGAGRDMILSATGLNWAPQKDRNSDGIVDDWAPPAGAGAVWTSGRLWGIYANNNGSETVDGGGSLALDSAGDIVFAEDDDDKVVGGLGDDYIDGGLGNDTLWGHGGNDVLDGGDGNEYILGDGILEPGYYPSLLETQHGNDVLDGGAGDDDLVGGGRDDGLFGGLGKDRLWGDDQTEAQLGGLYHGSDYLDGGDDDDQLIGGGRDDYLYGRAGADKLWGDTDYETELAGQYHGNDTLDGGDGNDQLVGGGGADLLVGDTGDDLMFGDARDGVVLTAQYEGNDILYGEAGIDQLVGGGGNDDLYGGDGNDQLEGEAGSDILDGGAGNDYLDGGTGADIMAGGADNDTYIVDDAGDVVIEAAGEGNDVIASSASIALPDNVEWLNLTGAGKIDAIGNAQNNDLTGNAAANRLEGGAGNDQLVGGAGTDTLVGGTGDDLYEIDDAGDAIIELTDEGRDFVLSTVSYTLASNVEGMSLGGAADLAATGNSLGNTLFGNTGNNTLIGRAGNDFLSGKAGDDIYGFNRGDGEDSIDDLDGLGATNTLRFAADIADSDVVAYRVADDMVLKLRGSSEQVGFVGYYAADTIDNGLVSNRKIDRVEFGNGVVWDQTMIQAAVDRAANNRAPVVNVTLPALQTYAGEAFSYVVPVNTIVDPDVGDSVAYSVSMPDGSPLPAWLAFDAATRTLSGPVPSNLSSLQFVLWGTDDYGVAVGQYVTLGVSMPNRAPVVSASIPDQTVSKDSFFSFTIGANAFSDPDAGDELAYSAVQADGSALPAWLNFDAATRTFSGTPTSQGTVSVRVTAKDPGNLAAVDVFDVIISAPDRVLNGTPGADYLSGNSGNDTFDGGPGNDTLAGGLGNDVYLFGRGDGQDTILETGGNADVLRFKAGISPGQVGVIMNDWQVNGEDSLVLVLLNPDGSMGADLVYIRKYFNLDDDTQRVDRFEFADGTVWTYADIQAKLPVVATDSDDSLRGFGGPDVIDGFGGGDWLYGKGGNDILLGGSGNDTLYGERGDDFLDGGDGDDDVQGGLGNDTLEGGAGNDRLLGYDVGNSGETGNDILHGGSGNDRLFGGEGNDIYLFNRGDGSDLVKDEVNADGSSSTDILRLGIGVLPEHVTLHRVGTQDLVVAIDGSNQQVLLSGYYFVDGSGKSDRSVERIEFDGGAGPVWTAVDIATRVEGGIQNAMTGTLADDTFVVDHEFDSITESANSGIDTVLASRTYALPDNVENLTLTGFLNINGTGNALNNILRGNKGDNILTGNGGYDTAYGGLGNDTYKGATPIELAGEGTDTYLGLGAGVLPNNIEIWQLNDGSGSRPNYYYTAQGNVLDNTLVSDGFGIVPYHLPSGVVIGDILDGGAGADTVIILGFDKPIVYVDNPGDRIVGGAYEVRSALDYALSEPSRASAGGYITSSVANRLTLIGNGAINGTGNLLNNSLTGNSANNILNGGEGADTLEGLAGDDTYIVDDLGDVVIENANGGVDTIQSYVTRTLEANLENLTLTGSAVIDGNGTALANVLRGNNAMNTLSGLDGDDTIYAGDNDTAIGGNGNDTLISEGTTFWTYLFGEAGDDILNGGPMSGVMVGGTGNDTITGGAWANFIWGDDQTGGAVGGTDIIVGGNDYDYVMAGAGDDLVYGNGGNDNLAGNLGNDTLYGGQGNDSLMGGEGVDTLEGGTGDDIYTVDNAADLVVENAGEGIDTVQSSFAHTLGANVENLTLTGTAAINGTGNALNNTLTGNGAPNLLTGGAGDDILKGGTTGTPASTLVSSLVIYARGTPVLDVYPIMQVYLDGILIQEFTVNATSYTAYTIDPIKLGKAAGKVDVVFTNDAWRPDLGQDRNLYVQKIEVNGQTISAAENGVFYDAGSGAAALDGLNLRFGQETMGSNGALRFTLADNDTLDGGMGADQMSGGSGNDTYIVDNVGDVLTELPNEGVDTVRSSISHALGANLENLMLTGSTAINGGGNALHNLLIGNAGNNALYGDAGADTLLGYTGNDRLDGGAGNDFLEGGLGNDTYVIDSSGDSLLENANAGWDTVESAFSYALRDNFEGLTLTGTAAINGAGNSRDNTLTGNSANNLLAGGAGNDTLNGGAGADTLIGGAGNDYYVVDNAGDIVTENWGEGTNDSITLYLNTDFALGTEIETLYRYGSGNWTSTGNAADNYLYGNGGSDTLIGLGGNDLLWGDIGTDMLMGGVGDDTYYVDNAGDVVIENASEGVDTVYVFGSTAYTLADNVEHGSRAFSGGFLTGNALDNSLSGSWSGDTLDGGAGADILIGFGGADTLIGGWGNDTYKLGRGDGTDTVVENDTTAGNIDIAKFLSGISADQIWFQKVGNNLETSLIGTADKLIIKDWYLGNVYHVEQFQTTDGAKTLTDSNVQNLVNAMASFAPPAAGQTTLPQNYQESLGGVIAANWQ